MAVTISLAQIAKHEGVSYKTAARWAKTYGWHQLRRPNRTLGVCALYDYAAVQADLSERDAA